MDEPTPRPAQPHATAADLAAVAGLSAARRALLTMELAARRRVATAVIPRQPREQPEPRFPLSYAQERLWFLDQADPGSVSYVMPGAIRLRGALDEDALRAALREIVRRHDVLRTVFISERGLPVQKIRPAADLTVATVDLTAVPAERRDDVLDDQRRDEATWAFTLASDLMLRARLLRFAADDHALLLTMHHIASDGWSIGVLVRELGALYSAFHRGAASPLPELAVQYADYAVWHRGWLAAGPLEAQLAYWREQLADAPVLDLPTDHPAPASRSSTGSSVPVAVAAEVAAQVTAFANAAGSTLYMVLAAAFAVVLSRWSGQPEVMIGLPVAGRRRRELEPLVGFFVNTLALRVNLSGSPSFEQLLARVRETCVAAYAHQDVPFERLVQDLAPRREMGMVPLVQAMLAVRDVPMGRLALGDLTAELLAPPTSQSTKFDIVLDLVPGPDGALTGYLEYSTDLFVRATAQRLAEAVLVVLAAALAEPGRPVDRLPVQSRAERDRWLLGELAGGTDVAPANGCLHSAIEARAAAQPGRWAVQCGATRLTYRELMARADRLAGRLHALGARPETLVGVCMAKSVDLVVALLGVLKAGAAYVPLDPGYPPGRVRTMLRDSAVSIVVTDEVSVGTGVLSPPGPDSEPGPRLVVLGPDDARSGQAGPAPAAAGLSRSLAYVIYTSGSTGTPKGSANEHGGVLRTLTELNRAIGLTADDRVLAMSSLNYDMSVYEIFGSLLAGACAVIPDEAEVTDPERLSRLLTEVGVTMWSSAPALLELLVDYEHTRGRLRGARLRLAGLAGDRIPPTLVERLHQMLPGLRLYNVAGMSEVSYCSTYHQVRRPEPAPGSIPWGRPLPGQRLYVLDRLGEPVPVGVRGELFIGGSGVRAGTGTARP